MRSHLLTLPTLLTIARIIFTPFIAVSIGAKQWNHAASLFICAAITDFLDGFLARAWNQETVLGALLDPLADKLCILSCYSVLALQAQLPWEFVFCILGKELLLVVGALGAFILYPHVQIQAGVSGKVTMLFQVVFIIVLIFAEQYDVMVPYKNGILSALVVANIVSLVDYSRAFYRQIHV